MGKKGQLIKGDRGAKKGCPSGKQAPLGEGVGGNSSTPPFLRDGAKNKERICF